MPTSDAYDPTERDPAAAGTETEDVLHTGFSLKQRLLNPRTVLSFGLAVAIMVFVLRGLDIDVAATWYAMRRVNPWLYALAWVAFAATFPVRALRWRVLLENADLVVRGRPQSWASLPALTEYIGLSWFVNCVVPAKLGDAYRAYLLKRNGQVSFSRTLGTILAERLLDMVMVFTLLVLSTWSVFGSHAPARVDVVIAVGFGMVVVIVGGLGAMRFLSPLIQRLIPLRLQPVYHAFEAGTLGALTVRTLPVLGGLTVLVWVLESLRLLVVIEAIGGVALAVPSIVFVALMSSLLTTIPATPGGLAVVDSAMVLVLRTLFGVPASLAVAVALLDRVISYWAIVIFGFVLYLVSRRK